MLGNDGARWENPSGVERMGGCSASGDPAACFPPAIDEDLQTQGDGENARKGNASKLFGNESGQPQKNKDIERTIAEIWGNCGVILAHVEEPPVPGTVVSKGGFRRET